MVSRKIFSAMSATPVNPTDIDVTE